MPEYTSMNQIYEWLSYLITWSYIFSKNGHLNMREKSFFKVLFIKVLSSYLKKKDTYQCSF